jgi:hypothetical protein
MKRLGTILSLALLASAIATTGAYAAAPDTVTSFFMACCDAICSCCGQGG